MWRLAFCACLVATGCAARPVELGFWMEPQSFQSSRIGDPITEPEFLTIDRIARAEIVAAFARYEVTVSANRAARFRVVVVRQLHDLRLRRRRASHAGESRAMAGFGGSGAVNFEYVANGAMVFSAEHASRETVLAALGRGIGRVAIHEFLHQLLPKSPIHDSKDPRSYEGNSAARVEGYFGELRWDIVAPWLQKRLKVRHERR